MKKRIFSAIAALLLPMMVMAQGWPENFEGVMLQGFYWDSYYDSKWTRLESQADELAPYFKLVWIPQSGNCGSSQSMGYDDLYWFSNYDSSFGTEAELRSMISMFKQKGIGTIADVVINHRKNLSSWIDFPAETYKGVTYQLQSTDICRDDDGGQTLTWATNNGYSLSSNNDTGEGWDGMRDLDHNSQNVQQTVLAYLDFLLNDLGYSGFRYDMTKGYAASFTGLYNSTAKPTYSVGEYWDGDKSKVVAWLNGTAVDGAKQSAVFDFPFRYSVRDAANGGNWTKLANGGLATDDSYKRYAVTFVENHDTEYRSATSQQDPIKKDTLAANAFLLAMPGTPCVFYKHWQDCKADLKNMILLRNLVGIGNQSEFSCTQSNSGRYVVTTTGTNGKLLAAVGTTVKYYTPSNEWALAAEGHHYRYYLQRTAETAWTSLPSGTYEGAQTVTLRAISATDGAQLVYTTDGTTPTAASQKASSGATIEIPVGQTTLRVALLVGSSVKGMVERTYNVESSEFTPYGITVRVNVDNVGWKNLNVWSWGGDGSHAPKSGQWPGDAATETVAVDGKQWYTLDYTINAKSDYVSFVFNCNSSTQTEDVNEVTQSSYFEIQSTKDSQGHYLVKDVTAEHITAIHAPIADNNTLVKPTCVLTLDGRNVRSYAKNVPTSQAIEGLQPGLYIVNGQKVVIR